ncbi:hypothetical protein P3X46_017925 [Hevea brasiliensis]|uniref:Pentatricopeptide repeat-containing protein n=1 Tax=Hevea brasiliensis TaxID=3981 RepID=A0ABQ9LP68_HEVBR|nr:hypothetical protein P3X46_017925 [Hevea brasiliensis]
MLTTGFSANSNSVGRLIASYACIGDLVSARHIFDNLTQRGVDAWNSMIIVYSRIYPGEVSNLYDNMITEGVRPDSSTFTVMHFRYGRDVFVAPSVLNLYAKCGKMDEAKVVFDKMLKKDIVSLTTMIAGFLRSRRASEAIDGHSKMQKEGIQGDEVAIAGLIRACGGLGDSKLVLSVHVHMVRREKALDNMSNWSSLHVSSGKIPRKNVISWGALISGFAQNGFVGIALALLVEMQSFGFKPDTGSLINALLACSQVGYLKWGKSLHGYIVRRQFEQVSVTALINMYAKCGALSYARTLFDQIDCRDILWNAMIARLVKEGEHWFHFMVNESKIQPDKKHYALEDAYQLIESMHIELGLAIWATLLSGCHNYRKLLIGEVAAKKILQSNPDDLGIYVLVSNFFSMAKKKVPGYSAVEENGKHQAFLMKDKSHYQYEYSLQILGILNDEMRAIRSVPETGLVHHNIEED